jgi:ABC-type multidrug transport system ATPase subunit
MITATHLEKSFGARRVLDGLDLSVDAGAVTLLVGANGAGKTTLLRILAGLSDPDAGKATVAGFDLRRSRREALASLSFLPQAPRFHPRLDATQVCEFYARLRGRSRADAARALEQWELGGHARTPTAKLSGGLRQRLGLAVFALADAPVLVLDEPGLSLDPAWRNRLQEFLTHEARRGRTVLVATHLLGEWEGHADRCCVLDRGRAAGELPPEALREAFPFHDRTRSSVAALPRTTTHEPAASLGIAQ